MSLGIASIWRIALQKAIITHNIHVSSYFSMRCHVLHRVSQEEKAFSGLTLDNDWRLLPLKLVNSSHLCTRQPICEPTDLIVVRRDDQNVVKRQGSLIAGAVSPARSSPCEHFSDRGDQLDFFCPVALSSVHHQGSVLI